MVVVMMLLWSAAAQLVSFAGQGRPDTIHKSLEFFPFAQKLDSPVFLPRSHFKLLEGNVGFTFGGDIVLADGASVEVAGGASVEDAGDASVLHDDGREMSTAPGTACKVQLK